MSLIFNVNRYFDKKSRKTVNNMGVRKTISIKDNRCSISILEEPLGYSV